MQLRESGAHIRQPATYALIEQSLNKSGLQHFVSGTDLGSKSIALQFQSVPFDNLADWLTDLSQSSTTHIIRWSATRLKNSGVVSAEVKLSI
jgi:type II secretory pathway component PulM